MHSASFCRLRKLQQRQPSEKRKDHRKTPLAPEPDIRASDRDLRTILVRWPDEHKEDHQAGCMNKDSRNDRFGEIGKSSEHEIDEKVEDDCRPDEALGDQ